MDHKKFQELAVRTESVKDKVELTPKDLAVFNDALEALVCATEVLDAYKKHIFYGKPLDYSALRVQLLKGTRTFNLANFEASDMEVSERRGDVVDPVEVEGIDPRVFHALLGTITEHGEITSALIDALGNNGELDLVNVTEELGDSDWYKALFFEATGIDWSVARAMIIKKLEVRYASQIFDEEEAEERDLELEREILERHLSDMVGEYLQGRPKGG